MTISTLLILAVCRTRVIHESCIWASSPRVLRSSVERASDRCTKNHRFKSCRGIASLDLKVAITKMRDIFIYQKRFDEENNNFVGASHFFAIFALLRRENGTFYGERKQETTTVYFSFWTWIWSLGIQLQEVSLTFEKVSGRVDRNNRDNDWKNAINFFLTTFSLPTRLWTFNTKTCCHTSLYAIKLK